MRVSAKAPYRRVRTALQEQLDRVSVVQHRGQVQRSVAVGPLRVQLLHGHLVHQKLDLSTGPAARKSGGWR